ncbi:EamA family transporter RarD [Aestuariimicrobium kwangyangense]|uniref:EamA family transporter RarD n=1 Tax=Aestuariimicrobium kwangyangense TaxID=396389 RepID=UPI00040F9945|nr:EamA family transporter RarD [Aestuariimicrobium kwangyangense]
MAAYVLWGVFPLFWALLGAANPIETLAERFVWSAVWTALCLVVLRQGFGWVRPALAGGQWVPLLLASIVIAVNWGMFIFAVQTGHTVESSLGYFINPLLNLVFGRIFFSERLDRWGWGGALTALVGVVVISWGSWHTVWISLLLATSFGIYGVLKKKAQLPALQGLFLESVFMTPLALVVLVVMGVMGLGHFGLGWSITALFVVSGLVTAVPLWLFAQAARGLPLGLLGMLQFIGPTLQLLIGLLVFHQKISWVWWVGLPLVWLGCALYLVGVLGRGRRSRGPAGG